MAAPTLRMIMMLGRTCSGFMDMALSVHLLAVPGGVDLAPTGAEVWLDSAEISTLASVLTVQTLVWTPRLALIGVELGLAGRTANFHSEAALYASGSLMASARNVVSLSATVRT